MKAMTETSHRLHLTNPMPCRIVARTRTGFNILTGLSGVLLCLAATEPFSGKIGLLFGLSNQQWADIHFWIGVFAIAFTTTKVTYYLTELKGPYKWPAKN
jgi:hypothetical protein